MDSLPSAPLVPTLPATSSSVVRRPPLHRLDSSADGMAHVRWGRRWFLDHCFCGRKKFAWAMVVLGVLVVLVIFGLSIYARALGEIRQWAALKMQLKRDTKALSRLTSDAILTGSSGGQPSAMIPILSWIELQKPPVNRDDGFFFLLDQHGQILAHSGAPHLNWRHHHRHLRDNSRHQLPLAPPDARLQRAPQTVPSSSGEPFPSSSSSSSHWLPFPASQRALDLQSQRSTMPLREILSLGQRGGGFVYFRWRHERNYLAFVFPVFGSDLLLGGAIPVPHNLMRSLPYESSSLPSSTTTTPMADDSSAPFSSQERTRLHGSVFGPTWLLREGMISKIEQSPSDYVSPADALSHIPVL